MHRGAKALGILLCVYLLLAYLLLPVAWRWKTHRRHPALVGMPRVTQTANGIHGDPVNLAAVATEEELQRLMLASHWSPADPITLASSLKIAGDTVLRRNYADAPVSSLYLWGHKQDLAFEKEVGNDPSRRHHVRFWRSPEIDDSGRPLWAGAVTFDKSVGLSHTTLQITHHIDPNVDRERDLLVKDWENTGLLADLYWIDDFQTKLEGKNGGGDPYFTDGRLAVGVYGGSENPAANPAAAAVTQQSIRIAAASDLKFVMDDLINSFQAQHPEWKAAATFDSSGSLYAQLTNKAPFDLYLSADLDYPRKLIAAGQGIADTEFIYAIGRIVLWVPQDSPIDVVNQGQRSLLDPIVKKIAMANPRHAPYGRLAEATLKKWGLYEQLRGKLVEGANIAQAAQYVESGAADIGILADSLAQAPQMRGKGKFWLVPASDHPLLQQGGVVLPWTKNREAALGFRAFLLSKEGQDVLKQFGFDLPGK